MQTSATAAEAAALTMTSSPASSGRYSSKEEDDRPVEQEPTFTPQDEQQELASLSITDIVNIESDLTGITLGLSGLRMNGGEAAAAAAVQTQLMSDALSRLEDELGRLPPAQTAVYRRAAAEFPHLITDERKMQFLECEDNDEVLTARRLAKHWEIRMELFGPGRCFLPMTMAGAMEREVEQMVKRSIEQLLPVTDTAGRAILHIDPSRRDFAKYSIEQEAMGTWYLLETLTETPELRRRGVVCLLDARNYRREQFTRKTSLVTDVLFSVLPIRMRALHLCHPNALVYYLFAPVMKRFLPRDFRLRVKFHYGSTSSVLQELERYRLPKDRLPVELGGDIALDLNRWAMDRLVLENSRLDTIVFSSRVDGPSAKRLRSENSLDFAHATPTSIEAAASNNRKRKNRRGKESDPRMAKAIEIKTADPDTSLYDALVAGGFVFKENSRIMDMVDADGITLTQRKNNLCRRLRQRKEREKEVQAKQNIECPNVETKSPTILSPGLVGSNQRIQSVQRAIDVAIYEHHVDIALSQQTNVTNQNLKDDLHDIDRNTTATDSRKGDLKDDDSFCDAINELPGIDDVDPLQFGSVSSDGVQF